MRMLQVVRNWQYRDRVRGSKTLVVGFYSVPEQVPDWVADLAVSQGVAQFCPVQEEKAIARAPANKAHRRAPKNK